MRKISLGLLRIKIAVWYFHTNRFKLSIFKKEQSKCQILPKISSGVFKLSPKIILKNLLFEYRSGIRKKIIDSVMKEKVAAIKIFLIKYLKKSLCL